jgi:DNA-binding CsgD family transcriptional regulator
MTPLSPSALAVRAACLKGYDLDVTTREDVNMPAAPEVVGTAAGICPGPGPLGAGAPVGVGAGESARRSTTTTATTSSTDAAGRHNAGDTRVRPTDDEQIEVVRRMSERGRSLRTIADLLSTSKRTVSGHRRHGSPA